ncbi:hypothetical protein AB6806_19845 [Bosea sp. RCC_152_1]|uniref:hypothetical protein n=1 Tax=Bosea sp. RCC_152_1 TaxID=3239228 RepID=UPI003523842C
MKALQAIEAAKNIVIQAYSPLTRTKRFDDGKLVAIAATYQKSPAQVLIRWNLQRGIVPLPKANRPGIWRRISMSSILRSTKTIWRHWTS